jgi:2-oxoglutarate ferredoxin oxidoreductase subunit delta
MKELAMPDEKKKNPRKARQIHIHRNLCKSCGICAGFCASQALVMDSSGCLKVADVEVCTACGLCELRCPDLAVEIGKKERENGGTDA